jgi:hypothetical protein
MPVATREAAAGKRAVATAAPVARAWVLPLRQTAALVAMAKLVMATTAYSLVVRVEVQALVELMVLMQPVPASPARATQAP